MDAFASRRLRLPLMAGCLAAALAAAACTPNEFFSPAPASLYDRMSQQDTAQSAATLQLALSSGINEPRTWRNTGTGNFGTITPVRRFVTDAGVSCAEYRERLVIGQREAIATNTACLSADGTWRRMATTAMR